MSDNIFQEVKQQLNIRQVIEHYGIQVDRHGKFKCVFHNDHKPSASIKNDYFHCFVCGAGGDLITFTAKYLGMRNIDACKELIRVFNLNINTNDDIKSQYAIKTRLKAEISKQNSIRDKFTKDKQIRSEMRKYEDYRLRNDIKQTRSKAEKEQEAYIHHVGLVLASYHCYLWQGIQMYPLEHERHIRGLQELTVCQYYLDAYEENPLEFTKNYEGVIKEYERELNSANQ